LELNLVIAFVGALADGFNDGVDKKAWKAPVLFRRLVLLSVLAIIFAVAIEELVSEEFLDAVKQELHQSRNLGFKRQLENEEVLVRVELLLVVLELCDLLMSHVTQLGKFFVFFGWKSFLYLIETLVHQVLIRVERRLLYCGFCHLKSMRSFNFPPLIKL